MRKNRLIPSEKAKKVIYLERRGRDRRRVPVWSVVFCLLGALCLLYCVSIAVMGFGTWFFLIWGAMGALFLGLGIFMSSRERIRRIPKGIRVAAQIVFWACAGLFCAVEGMILSRFHAKPDAGADFLIVLGAQWKADGPSDVLRRRLDRAAEYLYDNPDTLVIVSGGQGDNEPISEAAGMKQYLTDAGIGEERILTETLSQSTRENLEFSGRLLDRENDRVVIVTNNFHVFRALRLAQKLGYAHVEGLAADAYAPLLPNNMLREFLGIGVQFLTGEC